MFDVSWADVFAFDTPPLEILVRGTVVYLALFTLLRGVLHREAAAIGITDLLVVVLLADAAQNAMAGSYTTVPDGILLVSTIIFWAFTLDWLGYRFPRIQHFVHPRPLPLVRDGQLLWRNLRREYITREELMSQLRLQGMDDLDDIAAAYMESDGRISFITKEQRAGHRKPPERSLA